jgi:hypothetical protein
MLVQNPSTLRIGDRRQFRLGEDCTSALNFMRLRSLRDSFLRGFLRFVGLRRVKIKVVELAEREKMLGRGAEKRGEVQGLLAAPLGLRNGTTGS